MAIYYTYSSARYGHQINYNVQGGSSVSSNASAVNSNAASVSVSVSVKNTVPTRDGYTFSKWNSKANGTGTNYAAGTYISHTFIRQATLNKTTHDPVTGDTEFYYVTSAQNYYTTIYAIWTINTYTVSYNKGADGTGTNTTDTKTYNTDLTLKGAIFTRTGYEQTGWATSDGGAKVYDLGEVYTGNAAITLYPVWTATVSTVSTSNGTLGTAQTITITRYNNSFTHDLTYQYGSLTGTIATGVATSYLWTPAKSLAAAFPSAKSGVCIITCTTKNGGTTVGTSTTTCTLTIPSSVKCTVASVAVAETVAGLNAKFGAFIQGKSKVSLTGTINSGSGSPAYGATVKSFSITTNGQTMTSNGATTGLLNTVGTNNYSFKITDTRGYTHTKTGTYTVLAYSAPYISATVQRNNADDTQIDVNYSYAISACNNNNDKALKIKYKKSGGSYTTVNVTISQYSDTGTYSLTGLDPNGLYEVNVIATDYFGSAQITQNVAPVGNRVFDISATDKTIARHMSNPSDGWDHQANNEQFHGIIDIVPRRCSKSLSAEGWYRILKMDAPSCATSRVIDIAITRTHNTPNNESHCIRFIGIYNNFSFVNETSKSNTQIIDKIRYAKDDSYGYIDIHYAASASNNVYVDFEVNGSTAVVKLGCVAETLQDVTTLPADVTVPTIYDFSADGTGDITVNGTVTGQGFADLLFGIGNTIASNTNCDSITTEGKYTCPTSSVGSSLTNQPYTSAFGMLVLRVAEATRLVQIAMPNSTSITMKMRYYNGSSWTAWKTLTPS